MPAQAKSEMRTRHQDRASQRYQDVKARKACVDAVWERACNGFDGVGNCEDCGALVFRKAGTAHWLGHVHEKRARSLGGDETDPKACLLLCFKCHFNSPSGAHRRSVRASA